MNNLNGLYFPHITRILPTVFDDSVSYLEVLYKVLQKCNEIVDFTNDTEKLFEELKIFVETQLKGYDEKIIQDIENTIDKYITDGTIGQIINNTLLKELNDKVAELWYKSPNVKITISPSKQIYKKGESINSLVINCNITKGTEETLTTTLYKNGVATSTPLNNNQFIDSNTITDNVKYKVVVADSKNAISSNEIEISFVNPFLYGTDDIITNLTQVLNKKGALQVKYTCDNKYLYFAYPKEYGTLKQISNKNESIIELFTITTTSYNNEDYYIYKTPHIVSVTDYELDFLFE